MSPLTRRAAFAAFAATALAPFAASAQTSAPPGGIGANTSPGEPVGKPTGAVGSPSRNSDVPATPTKPPATTTSTTTTRRRPRHTTHGN